MKFDLIIKGGTVLDGVSNEGYLADIGIAGDRIKAIGDLQDAQAESVVIGENYYVSPGFVDIQNHSDSYLTLLEIPNQKSLVSQGITTIVVGHCGASLGPLPTPEALKSVQKWRSLAGANLNWLTFAEYLDALEKYKIGVNVASLVGHSTIRRGLLGDEARSATPEEIKITLKVLGESLMAGAAGASLGLMYAHEVDSSKQELLEFASLVGKNKKVLSVHLRSEGSHITEALEEVVGLARESGVCLKISHLKVRGKRNWPELEQVLNNLDRVYQKGIDVFFDVYPYTSSWEVLYTYLPKWAYEGGREAIIANLRDETKRRKILAFLKMQEENFGDILIATSETNPAFIGKTLKQIAENQEIGVEDALLNVLEGTNAQVVVFDRNLSDDNLNQLLKHPLSVVATDGAGYDFDYSALHGLVHPRCFGTMPKFLSMVREQNLMSWAAAIKKISSKPADKVKLKDRGKIMVGNFADIVVFDPHNIGARASYQNPYQLSIGIKYVFVNGHLAFSEGGDQIALPGRVLRVK